MTADQDCPLVYIAEDNPILLQGLRQALISNGYSVRTAPDGTAMLRLIESQDARPDVLLLDVMMPGMSGVELLRSLRADQRWSRLPVILITAATDDAATAAMEQDAAVELLTKPFRLNDLLDRVARHGGGAPAARPEP